MWFELVLNGVGGRTIQEAKENMNLHEAIMWREYRNARGSLNPARRLDTAITKLTFYTLAIAGNKDIKLEELLWWEQSLSQKNNNSDDGSTLEQMLMMLKTQSSNKTRTTTKFKRS